jgi:hypothetical protein
MSSFFKTINLTRASMGAWDQGVLVATLLVPCAQSIAHGITPPKYVFTWPATWGSARHWHRSVRGISSTYTASTLGKCTNLAPFPLAHTRVLPCIALVGTNRRFSGSPVQDPSLNVKSCAVCTYHLGLIIVQNVSFTDVTRDVAAVGLHMF